jgi:hypothetical protein
MQDTGEQKCLALLYKEDNGTRKTMQDRKVRNEQDQERAENTSTVKTTLGKGKDNLTLQQEGQDVCSSGDRKFAVAGTGQPGWDSTGQKGRVKRIELKLLIIDISERIG